MLDVIYCAGGNPEFARIAIENGMKYGSQLVDDTPYWPIYFADQNWKNPNREQYMVELAQYKPHMATVLDLERRDQLDEVLGWAHDAAEHVEVVIIIPKVDWIHKELPEHIKGKEVRLGYSVPTRYAGSPFPISHLIGHPLHLLGGSPQKQMQLYRKTPGVLSVDCNMMNKMAAQFCAFWSATPLPQSKYGHWPTIEELEGTKGEGAPQRAFEMSCKNIMQAWKETTDAGGPGEIEPLHQGSFFW